MDPELQGALLQFEERVSARIAAAEERINKRFDATVGSIESINKRIGATEESINSINNRLDVIEERINNRFEVTERRFAAQLEATEERIGRRFETTEQHFNAQLEATETKLLTSFHNWAQTYEVRARGVIATVHEFEERLGLVEERLSKLERSKN